MSLTSIDPDDTGGSRDAPLERLIRFRLRERHYAFRMAAVAGLAERRRLRRVEGAPAGVLGLAEWRGRLLTVLDLPCLLDDSAARDRETGCLVRLADPYDATAMWVPAEVRLVRCRSFVRPVGPEERSVGAVGTVLVDGIAHVLLDPTAVVRQVEAALDADAGFGS